MVFISLSVLFLAISLLSITTGDWTTTSLINSIALHVPTGSTRTTDYLELNGTCEECLCAIANEPSASTSYGSRIGSFNCFKNNKTCQLFSSGTFYDFWIGNDTNITFYFFEMPQRLNDSGLVLWHSFKNGSHNDSSGNSLNANAATGIQLTSGRIDDAFSFYLNSSYYQISNVLVLGQMNAPYSVALWIQSYALFETPILHLSQYDNGQGWCIDMFGLLANGQLVARSWANAPRTIEGPILPCDSWTHIAVTYDSMIGLRLYTNGTLVNTTLPFSFYASNAPMYVTLAHSMSGVQGGTCNAAMIAHTGTFFGAIDELRIYAKQLTSDDIFALANP